MNQPIPLAGLLTIFLGTVSFAAECTFFVNMTGPQEFPSLGDPDGTASGTISLNDISGLISWNFIYANIMAPTAMHIHTGAAGVQGGVLINLGVATSGGPGTLIGSTTHGIPAEVTSILNDPTGFYVNIHTAPPFASGAVRGQIGPEGQCSTLTTAGIGALAMFVTGLGTVIIRCRTRKLTA